MNFDPVPFDVWQGLLGWALVFGVLAVAGFVVGLIFSFVNAGTKGPSRTIGQIKRFGRDMLRMSPRRIFAIAQLTFRDSIRRKALFVFIIFFLLFMFAGWFVSETNTRPEMQVKVHVSFVLQSIAWLIIPAMLLLSCWGLPEDIKARSLHTVVTKPTRKNEIYIGRILGLTGISTLMLAGMGAVGYIWTIRQVPEEAQSELVSRVPVYGQLSFIDPRGNPQDKGINVGDIWTFRSYIAGGTRAQAIWEFDGITKDRFGEHPLVIESRMEAFRTHKGVQKRGLSCEINLLNNLRYQTALALGVSQKFPQIHDRLSKGRFAAAAGEMRRLANGIEGQQAKLMTKSVYEQAAVGYADFARLMEPFRESRPDDAWIVDIIDKTNECKVAAENSRATELAAALRELGDLFEQNAQALEGMLVDKVAKIPSFELKEFGEPHQEVIKSTVTYLVNGQRDVAPKTGDLFEHFVHGGRLRVGVRGLDGGQYIGMARPDLFIRMPNRHFWVGFAKAVVGIWLMSVLVIIVGVTASCFVKGPVATLLTFVIVILGSGFHGFLEDLVKDEIRGSGAISAAYRLGKHLNPQTELKDIPAENIIRAGDNALLAVAWGAHKVVPNFQNFRVAPYVANGFDVPWNAALLPAMLTVFAYFIPCLMLGYFSLNLRELEEK